MLNSDMCLAYKKQSNGGFLSAKHASDCCGWMESEKLFDRRVLIEGESNAFCGTSVTESQDDDAERDHCCATQAGISSGGGDDNENDCDDEEDPKGPAIDAVMDFAASEENFITGYTQAWWLATENGVHAPTFSCLPSGTYNNANILLPSLNLLLLSSISLVLFF